MITFREMPANEDGVISILQHGYVKLVSDVCWGNDNTPLAAARMSTGKPTGLDDLADDNLRRRLWRDQHTSPFEMAGMTVEVGVIKASAVQTMRHRTFGFNEYSGRYSEMPDVYEVPTVNEVRRQSDKNKQMSDGLASVEAAERANARFSFVTSVARVAYEEMLKDGVAKEQARFVLPQNQYTYFQMTGNMLNWLKFFNLRLRLDVQPETQEMAWAMANHFRSLFPKTWALFEEYTLNAVSVSRSELEALQMVIGHYNYAMQTVGLPGAAERLVELLGEKDGSRFIERLGPTP